MLASIYVIAEEMIDPTTKNLVLRDLKREMCCRANGYYRYPGKDILATIYKGTASANNPARRFMVHVWLRRWDKDSIQTKPELFPQEFQYFMRS